jgi:hypothetical protein
MGKEMKEDMTVNGKTEDIPSNSPSYMLLITTIKSIPITGLWSPEGSEGLRADLHKPCRSPAATLPFSCYLLPAITFY